MRVQRAPEGRVLDRSGEPCYQRPRRRRENTPGKCDHCQVKFRSGHLIDLPPSSVQLVMLGRLRIFKILLLCTMSFATFQIPAQGIGQRWGATRALWQVPIRMGHVHSVAFSFGPSGWPSSDKPRGAWGQSPHIRLFPFLSYIFRCLISQAAVQSFRIVVLAPRLCDCPGIRDRIEDFLIQTFVPEPAVKAFTKRILPWFAWFNILRFHALLFEPVLDFICDKFRTIIASDVCWDSTDCK